MDEDGLESRTVDDRWGRKFGRELSRHSRKHYVAATSNIEGGK